MHGNAPPITFTYLFPRWQIAASLRHRRCRNRAARPRRPNSAWPNRRANSIATPPSIISNAVITWYRDATTKIKSVGLPSDAIYLDNARNLASEAVRLAFQSARAEANIMSATAKVNKATPTPAAVSGAQPTQQQNLAQTATKVSAQIDDTQSRLEELNKQIATAPRSEQKDLLAQRDRLQGLLTLDKALQDTIQKMASFVGGTTEGAEGLEGSINELARSVPEVVTDESSKKPAASPAANAKTATVATSSGLIGQSLALFDQMQSMHQIDQMAEETSKMRATADALRKTAPRCPGRHHSTRPRPG